MGSEDDATKRSPRCTLGFGLALLAVGVTMTFDAVQRATVGPDRRSSYVRIWESEGDFLPASTMNAAGWFLVAVGAFLCLTLLGPRRR